MQPRKANQPHFLFLCGDLPQETFSVARFEGQDTISQPYRFWIDLHSPRKDVPGDDVIGRQASLLLYRDGVYLPYSGIVSKFSYMGSSVDYTTYRVQLAPRLWSLELNTRSRIFQRMSVPEVVKQVLLDAGLGHYYDFDLQEAYPEEEYIVQYQETDLNFCSRLLEQEGIWYFFRESVLVEEEVSSPGAETMVVSDHPASFGYMDDQCEIPFRSPAGLHEHDLESEVESVSQLNSDRKMIPGAVQLRNYNYRTPDVELSSDREVNSGVTGTDYRFGGSCRDTDRIERAAAVHAGRLATAGTEVSGEGSCRRFRAGTRFSLIDHTRDDCNDRYLIREVEHFGQHTDSLVGKGVYTYRNAFRLVPSENIEYFRPRITASVPRVSGILSARVEAEDPDHASLDEMGRYRVRFPFDLSGTPNHEGSKYVRLAQPYSGANYGIHFPSHENTEMLLACIDGDPNKPVGIGTVPNADTVSPVVCHNRTQGIIRSAGNNEILLDDTADKQKIRITSAAGNVLALDDEERRASMRTTDKNRIVLDDKNEEVLLCAGDHLLAMIYRGGEESIVLSTGGGHAVRIDDAGKCVAIRTKGGHLVDLDDGKGTIVLADGKGMSTVMLDGSGGLSLDSKGNITINAGKDIEIKAANIRMHASPGKIEGRAEQDMKFDGMNVALKGSADVKIEAGMNLGLTGNTLKAEGRVSAEVKGGVQARMSGAIAELTGSGTCTVKGGVVMVN